MDESDELIRDTFLRLLRYQSEEFAKAEEWEKRQEAAAASLFYLVQYSRRDPALKGFLAPLEHLAAGVSDLAEGAPHPILKNYKTKVGARSHTSNEILVHGFAVALVELLIDAGFEEAEALIRVSEHLAKAGVIGSRNKLPVSPHSVRSWRATASSGSSPLMRDAADTNFTLLKAIFSAYFQDWPPRRREALKIIEIVTQLDFLPTMANTGKTNC